jgi:hypothetical protein
LYSGRKSSLVELLILSAFARGHAASRDDSDVITTWGVCYDQTRLLSETPTLGSVARRPSGSDRT